MQRETSLPTFAFKCVRGLCEVDVPNLVTIPNRTPLFEWYVVRCGFKNGYPNDMCSKEIGQRAQNMITILGSIVNTIKRTYTTT